jgi:glutamyl-tRNA synthetase
MEMKTEEKEIITRFAPSPTGFLHLGSYRTAIYSYLFAKQHGGKFVLRIEDTDRVRSKKEFEENIIESLQWLDVPYDEFYRQSEHVDRHRECLEQLIREGKAYISKEEAKDGSGEIKEIVRFKNPNKIVTFTDLIRGEIRTDTTDLGDFVIAKNIHEPLFHLAVVVDDADEGVTHVIRGEDHISNTPRHILLYEALGMPVPKYAHLPLVLSEDRTKLSKRKGAQPVTFYRDEGYLPGGILNFIVLVGWNDTTDEEIYTMKDLLEKFDLSRVHKAGAVFNPKKLEWINKEHVRHMEFDDQVNLIEDFLPESIQKIEGYTREMLVKIAPVIMDRITHFGELRTMAEEGELHYFFERPTYDIQDLLWKKNPDRTVTKENLNSIISLLEGVQDDFDADTVKDTLWKLAEERGRGDVLWPMRYALSGKEKSPDPFLLASILGKEETIARLHKATNQL